MTFPSPRATLTTSTAAIALALFGPLLAVPAWAETVTGVPLDASFKAADRASSMLKVIDADKSALKGIQRAAISSFQVEFVTKGAASASSYEIGRSGRASTNTVITLVGVGGADFQAITEQLHGEFVRDLKGMGIEVVPTSKIVAAAAYKKMAASGKPSPAETRTSDTWSTVYAPGGLGIYGVGSSSNAVAIFAGFSAFSDVSSTMFANIELAKELDAAVVVVRMVVNFVSLKSSDSSWFGRSSGTATVRGEVSPSVAGTSTTMFVQRPTTNATMTLQSPLLIDSAAISEVKDTSSVVANVGLAVLSLAIGGGNSSSAVEKEAVADAAQYRTLVSAGVGTVREMFMTRLRAGQ